MTTTNKIIAHHATAKAIATVPVRKTMSLNVTLEDLRLGRYEAQKRVLLKRFVQQRAIIKDPEGGRFPPRVLRSELLDFMVEACGETGVIVVQADRGLGKSTAAKFFLKNSAGGIMFCNCASTVTSGCYWKGVAEALGIPKTVYETNADWEELLVSAVSAAVSPEELRETPSWADSFIDGFLSWFSGVGPVEDEAVPTIDGLDVTPLKETPTIVFDDFNDVKEEDIVFMKHIYPIVKAMDVLLFVLVRDKATADSLVRLNGWGRIAPLARICRDVSCPGDEEKKPQWTPINWTRDQLEEIVRSRFGNILAHMREIQDGENPLDVLDEARRLVRRSQS